ncbi:MAG: anthranilate synthase component I, partial [Solirubrobacterales bacterium]
MSVVAEQLPDLEPGLDEARELAREASVVPVRQTFVDDTETPVSAFLKLRGDGPSFLLESAEQGRLGRYSFLGFSPRAELRWSDGTLSEWRGAGAASGAEPDNTSEEADPYGAVAAYLERYELAELDGLPPFAGGAVGFFGYDLVRTVETKLGEPNPDPVGLPDLALLITDVMLCFDHQRHELTVLANAFAEDEGGIEAAYAAAAEKIAAVRERLRGPVPDVAGASIEAPRFESNMKREQFEANVAR